MKNRDLPRWSTLFFGLSAPALVIAVAIDGYLHGLGFAETIGFVWLHIAGIMYAWLLFGGLLYCVISRSELRAFFSRISTPSMRKAIAFGAANIAGGVAAWALVLWHPFGLLPSIGVGVAIYVIWVFLIVLLSRRMSEQTKQSLKELQGIVEKINDDEDHTMYGV